MTLELQTTFHFYMFEKITCTACDGIGYMRGETIRCFYCEGTGLVTRVSAYQHRKWIKL
jgi:DnaJ-class molecular chaperone